MKREQLSDVVLIPQTTQRLIIFVAHSLGSIIIKSVSLAPT